MRNLILKCQGIFIGPCYLCSKDKVVWLWHLQVNLYIWLTILSCYGSIPSTLGLIRRDGGLSTLCHSCEFACQQRVLKRFPWPWLSPLRGWDSLTVAFTGKFVYLYLYLYLSIYLSIYLYRSIYLFIYLSIYLSI